MRFRHTFFFVAWILSVNFAFSQDRIDKFRNSLTGEREKTWLKETKIVKEERLGGHCKSELSYTFKKGSDTAILRTCVNGKWDSGKQVTYKIVLVDGTRLMLNFSDSTSYLAKFVRRNKKNYLRLTKTSYSVTTLDKDLYFYE